MTEPPDLPADPFGDDLRGCLVRARLLWDELVRIAAQHGEPGLAAAIGTLDVGELRWMVVARVLRDLGGPPLFDGKRHRITVPRLERAPLASETDYAQVVMKAAESNLAGLEGAVLGLSYPQLLALVHEPIVAALRRSKAR